MSVMYDLDLAGLTRSYRLQFLDHLEAGVRRSMIGLCKTLTGPHRDFNRWEAVQAVLTEAERLRKAPQVPLAEDDDDQDDLLAILGRLESTVIGIHYLMSLMPEQHDQLQAVYNALELREAGARKDQRSK